MVSEIKNIILDWGGIIIGLDENDCIEAFKKIGAPEVAQAIADGRKNPVFSDFESGRCDTATFIQTLRALSPHCTASDKELAEAWNAMLSSIPQQRLEKIAELGKHYRMFLLSNTNEIHWLSKIHCWNMVDSDQYSAPEDYFEKVFLSHELGVMKPDERIYRKVLDMANIQAENTLFIDDNYNNCEVAKECGINTMNVSALDEVLLYYDQVVY